MDCINRENQCQANNSVFFVLGAYGMREVKYMAETGHIGPI